MTDGKDLQLQGMFLDVESRQLFWMQERFHGRAALQAQGKTVFHFKLWRALPTLAVQPLSLLLPGFIIHPSFMLLMLWGSSQLLHYCKNGLSLLQNISQYPGVSDESGPGLALSKQHHRGWGQ